MLLAIVIGLLLSVACLFGLAGYVAALVESEEIKAAEEARELAEERKVIVLRRRAHSLRPRQDDNAA